MNLKKQHRMNQSIWIAGWITILLFGILGVAPLIPPAPPESFNPSDFNLSLAMDHLNQIAQEPRPMGSAASLKVRHYLVDQLTALGLEPQLQTLMVGNYYTGVSESVEIANVVARIPGTAPTSAVALAAHYDTVPGTPGANDDASSVALMLELARAVLAGPPNRNDIILIFTDCEEPAPRYGSTAFVSDHPWSSEIGFVINLEAIGSGGPSTIIGMSGDNSRLIDLYSEGAPYPAAFSFLTATADLVGGSNSDFATFKDVHIPGVEFAYLRGSSIYHTPADNLERVGQNSVLQQGANALGLTRLVANQDLNQSFDHRNSVFFNLGQKWVVRYSEGWSGLAAVLALGIIAASLWYQRSWGQIIKSIAVTLLSTVVAGAAGALIWIVLATRIKEMRVTESYLILTGLILVTAGIVTLTSRFLRRKIAGDPDTSGVLILWWLTGVLLVNYAPGMSYLFIWPALAGSAALLYRSRSNANRRWRMLLSLPVVWTLLVVLLPAVDIFFALAQPRPGNPDSEMLPVIAFSVILIALTLEGIRSFWIRPLHESRKPEAAG